MFSPDDEALTIPMLVPNELDYRIVSRWSFLLGSLFGIFLHLSLLGVNVLFWWSFEPLFLQGQAELIVSIVWTTTWAVVVASLAVMFLWSLSKLVTTLYLGVSQEVLLILEVGFVKGCLCSLLLLETIYTTSQLTLSDGYDNLYVFLSVVLVFGGAVYVWLFRNKTKESIINFEDKHAPFTA